MRTRWKIRPDHLMVWGFIYFCLTMSLFLGVAAGLDNNHVGWKSAVCLIIWIGPFIFGALFATVRWLHGLINRHGLVGFILNILPFELVTENVEDMREAYCKNDPPTKGV